MNCLYSTGYVTKSFRFLDISLFYLFLVLPQVWLPIIVDDPTIAALQQKAKNLDREAVKRQAFNLTFLSL